MRHSGQLLILLVLSLLTATAGGCRRQQSPDTATGADTPENRRAAAQRYMQLVPLDETLEGMARQLATQHEVNRREALVQLLKQEVRRPVLEEAITAALVRHFSVAEINALADFNARPEARGIQRKMPAYTADLMPGLQQEIVRVLSMTNAALAALQWPTRVRSFQATAADEQLVADFAFVNRGERTVNILAITSTCAACISGVTDRTNIPPQHGGVVSVRFDFGMRTGPQSKAVLVQTDDPNEPQVRLQLDVHIPEVVRLEPTFSAWQVGAQPVTKTNRVTVLYPGARLEGITPTPPIFRADWYPITAARGEICVTPTALTARAAGRLDVLVRVPPGVVRRFPLYLAIGSEKTPGP
jgi:hypothetical protein